MYNSLNPLKGKKKKLAKKCTYDTKFCQLLNAPNRNFSRQVLKIFIILNLIVQAYKYQ